MSDNRYDSGINTVSIVMPDSPETPYLLPDWLHGFEYWLKNLSDGESTFYGSIVLGLFIWLGTKIWQRITHKSPIFEGEIYDLTFPDTDNSAMVGRESLLTTLNQAWQDHTIHVFALVAWAGVGKTALVNLWREAIKVTADEALRPQRIYAWSFQNQGIANAQTSSGAFFNHALRWFKSDRDTFGSEHEKGVYLAKLINTQRTLLILDGLEVFQPYQTAELQGQLNDSAMLGLLQTLAKANTGLCLIATRQALGEQLTRHSSVRNHPLENLPMAAAVQLLRLAGVKGKQEELAAVANEYHGHAYSLTLLANYLRQYCKGDIRRRDTLPALTDDTRPEGWQAQQLLWGYAEALEGREDLGLLYVASVFDQAVERGLILELIRALKIRYQSALNKLNIARLDEPQRWVDCFHRLRKQGLLLGNDYEWLDLHPLVRDFFRHEFQLPHGGIKHIIHKELYAYYKALPEKEFPDTLEEMQPLFSAVAHGCAAGLHQQALDEVYWPRIQRKGEHYPTKKLGAFSDALATVAHFFTTPWQTPAAGLGEIWQAGVLNWAGFRLRALGRLREAVEPMQAAVDLFAKQEDWQQAAINASNLSELQLTLGDLAEAVSSAAQSVVYADKSGDMLQRMSKRTTHADALHQTGQAALARELFQAAEALQQEDQPDYPRLYSLWGFRYCDLLLAQGGDPSTTLRERIGEVLERAEYDLDCWTNHFSNGSLLDFSLPKLTLGRAHLQQLLLPSTSGRGAGGEGLIPRSLSEAEGWLEQAVAGLRAAGTQDMLPRGLLARAALFRHTHDFARARQDLQEVFDIAEPSGMRLHLTDYHLEMARLLVAEALTSTPLPEVEGLRGSDASSSCSPSTASRERGAGGEGLQHHIAEAARLINATGYHRRDPELAELQQHLA
jgi:tetratricopeptide (TPR) repeat protein